MCVCCSVGRGRNFNWLTISLLAGWISVVALIAEFAPPGENVSAANMADVAGTLIP